MPDNSRVQHSQRLELIGTVASGVAHDLNNLLTVILNHLDFALYRLESNHPVRANLADVQRAAMRSTELMGALLSFGARTPTRYQRMNLTTVIEETVRLLLRRVMPSTIEIVQTVDPKLGTVLADATQIQQILVNLSVNARDAMPRGGSLEISAKNQGDKVVLSVRDNGSGITAEVRERIFEPFYTTKGDSGGSGLGLAMVASIVDAHQGSITVESDPGQGTTFQISLPTVSKAPVHTSESCGKLTRPKRPMAGCVLVAEDDDLVRGVARTTLQMQGYRVLEARDGDEAVRVFSDHAEEIDMVFFDVTMPHATGTEALSRVRWIKPQVKALLTSGYSSPLKEEFLYKPYTAFDLARKVDKIMAL